MPSSPRRSSILAAAIALLVGTLVAGSPSATSAAPLAQGDERLVPDGYLWGTGRHLAVDPDAPRAYVAAGEVVLAYDIGEDDELHLRAVSPRLSGPAVDLDARFGRIAVALGGAGVALLNDEGDALSLRAEVPTRAADLVDLMSESRVALATDRSVTTLDVSDPGAPLPPGALTLPSCSVEDLSADGVLIAVACEEGAVHLVSAANPAAPELLATNLGMHADRVHLRHGRLVVSGMGPAAPEQLVYERSEVPTVAVYTGLGPDTTRLEPTGRLPVRGFLRVGDLAVSDDLAFLAVEWPENGFAMVVDISDPAAPQLRGARTMRTDPNRAISGFASGAGHLLVLDDEGLHSTSGGFDDAALSWDAGAGAICPRRRPREELFEDDVNPVALQDDLILTTSAYCAEVIALRIEESRLVPADQVALEAPPSLPTGLAMDAGRILAGGRDIDGLGHIWIGGADAEGALRWRSKATSEELGIHRPIRRVALDGYRVAVLSDETFTLLAVGEDDGLRPVASVEVPIGGWSTSLDIQGHWAVAGGYAGAVAIDLREPTQLEVSRRLVGGHALSVALDGDRLYVMRGPRRYREEDALLGFAWSGDEWALTEGGRIPALDMDDRPIKRRRVPAFIAPSERGVSVLVDHAAGLGYVLHHFERDAEGDLRWDQSFPTVMPDFWTSAMGPWLVGDGRRVALLSAFYAEVEVEMLGWIDLFRVDETGRGGRMTYGPIDASASTVIRTAIGPAGRAALVERRPVAWFVQDLQSRQQQPAALWPAGPVLDVAWRGHHLFVLSGTSSDAEDGAAILEVFDVSSPASPRGVARLEGLAGRSLALGAHRVVVYQGGSATIVNARDPSRPWIVRDGIQGEWFDGNLRVQGDWLVASLDREDEGSGPPRWQPVLYPIGDDGSLGQSLALPHSLMHAGNGDWLLRAEDEDSVELLDLASSGGPRAVWRRDGISRIAGLGMDGRQAVVLSGGGGSRWAPEYADRLLRLSVVGGGVTDMESLRFQNATRPTYGLASPLLRGNRLVVSGRTYPLPAPAPSATLYLPLSLLERGR